MRLIGDGLCEYCKRPTGNHINGKCCDVCDRCYKIHKKAIQLENKGWTQEMLEIEAKHPPFTDELIALAICYPVIIMSVFYNIRNIFLKVLKKGR